MKVWWCEEHKNTGTHLEVDPATDRDDRVCGMGLYNIAMEHEYGEDEDDAPCRMVEGWLTVERLLEMPNNDTHVVDRPVLDSIEGVDPSEYSISLPKDPWDYDP